MAYIESVMYSAEYCEKVIGVVVGYWHSPRFIGTLQTGRICHRRFRHQLKGQRNNKLFNTEQLDYMCCVSV